MIDTAIKEIINTQGGLSYGYREGAFFHYNPENLRTYGNQVYTCRESTVIVWTEDYVKLANGSPELVVPCKSPYLGMCLPKYDMNGKSCDIETDIQKFDKCLSEIEKNISIPEENRTIIYRTPITNVIAMKLSSFWVENFARKSLFTLIARGIVAFYKTNFLKDLDNYPLARECKPAIERFLNGYTKEGEEPMNYKDHIMKAGGFVKHFKERTQSQLDKMLVKP